MNNIYGDLEKKIENKYHYYKNLINESLVAVQQHKARNILSTNDLNIYYKSIREINYNLKIIESNYEKTDFNLSKLQNINDIFSNMFKYYGTCNVDNILIIAFGTKYLEEFLKDDKYKLLQKFFRPCGYKNLKWKNEKKNDENKSLILQKNKIIEDYMIIENSISLDCFDLARTSNNFYLKTNGLKVCFQCPEKKITMIISGYVENIYLNVIDNTFLQSQIEEIKKIRDSLEEEHCDDFDRYRETLSLKEILVYDSNGIYHRFKGFCNFINQSIKKKELAQIVKEFVSSDMFEQRKQLIYMLIKSNDTETQYLSYLLYDLLSNETNNNIDTLEQTIIYDSLPWNIKTYFKEAMNYTLNYTNIVSNDKNIPLEQQICLMKASDEIKEKAMIKLKEVKSKSEDSGFKARQYLEGLLKIPFGIYKQEAVLNYLQTVKDVVKSMCLNLGSNDYNDSLCVKDLEFILHDIEKNQKGKFASKCIDIITDELLKGKIHQLTITICHINTIIKKNKLCKTNKISYSGKTKPQLKACIKRFITDNVSNKDILKEIVALRKNININDFLNVDDNIKTIKVSMNKIKKNLNDVEAVLDDAVHGHKNAKKQIERIIGQWISGKKSGYCFGFEGPPGLGKTSLAKRGISNCLKDEDGNSRPFSFIAIGGSSNGSVLDGHSYTYVGSTWGKIVDILMNTKCMNPIIFIDELDKISKTEHGKEIIGILTHLVDTTQNDCFQDKYFSGIPLDLSKVLFIFSYNDASLVDPILLDRIHRIKFDPLTIYEKVTICKKYILPEMTKEINLYEKIKITDKEIIFIIDNYTFESGVRKLKEVFFEIINEINLMILKSDDDLLLPYELTIEKIENVFLKDKDKISHIKIPRLDSVGIVNGLWANSYGKGGIIPIESKLYPTNNSFELKLTGQQGDVMKESMIVARTLAWNYMKNNNIDIEKIKTGIHVHCPEGAVPKDGPSAGLAITLSLLSLLLNRKVRRNIGITGEINLQGNITAIGGLELKVIGGIKGGVTTFLFPKENDNDYKKIIKRYDSEVFSNIKFISVDNLIDAIDLVLL